MEVSKEKRPEMNISQEMPTVRPVMPPIPAAVAPRIADCSAEAPVSSTADQATLSSAASLASQAASVPDVRQEKVAAIQAALAGGTYSVSSQDVAQSMMDHMLGKKA